MESWASRYQVGDIVSHSGDDHVRSYQVDKVTVGGVYDGSLDVVCIQGPESDEFPHVGDTQVFSIPEYVKLRARDGWVIDLDWMRKENWVNLERLRV